MCKSHLSCRYGIMLDYKIIKEGERKMKYELKNPGKSWWVKGMVVEGEINGRSEILEINSIDICRLNKDIMTKEQIINCMEYPRYGFVKDYLGNKVPFSLDDLEPYEEVLISHNTKVCIVYVLSIILIISAFMWAMDLCYNVSLFLPLFVTILFTLIVIIATCLALCELEF